MMQLLLNAKRCSGRGVKIRTLSPDERDRASIVAAKVAGKDAQIIEFSTAQLKEFVTLSVVEVTKQSGFKTMDDLMKPDVEWIKVTPAEFAFEGPLKYSKLFNAKDDDILGHVVNSLLVASRDEVEDIVGKALMVSED